MSRDRLSWFLRGTPKTNPAATRTRTNKKKSAEYFKLLVDSKDYFIAWGAEPTAFLPYFRALALKGLFKTAKSADMLKGMIKTGEEILNVKLHEALQDNSVKVRQSQKSTKAEGCLYLTLANAGLGINEIAGSYLKQAKELRQGSLDVIFTELLISK